MTLADGSRGVCVGRLCCHAVVCIRRYGRTWRGAMARLELVGQTETLRKMNVVRISNVMNIGSKVLKKSEGLKH